MNKIEKKSKESNRLQIEVIMKASQYELIKKIAKNNNQSVNDFLRDLLLTGIKSFDIDSNTLTPTVLLNNYQKQSNNYHGDCLEKIIVFLERKQVMKIRLRSGEYGLDCSLFSNLMIIKALNEQ